jgi:hypothetical protein
LEQIDVFDFVNLIGAQYSPGYLAKSRYGVYLAYQSFDLEEDLMRWFSKFEGVRSFPKRRSVTVIHESTLLKTETNSETLNGFARTALNPSCSAPPGLRKDPACGMPCSTIRTSTRPATPVTTTRGPHQAAMTAARRARSGPHTLCSAIA